MLKFIRNFRANEDGAVTVEWVVLTALVCGLSVTAYNTIQEGATALTEATAAYLEEQSP